jgi:signal transduction histidine kinase
MIARAPAFGRSAPRSARRAGLCPARRLQEAALDPVSLTAFVGGAGVVAAVAIAEVPALRFAYPAGMSRVATETALAVCAVLAAVLLAGRSRDRTGFARMCLVAGVTLLAGCAVLQSVGRISGGIDAWWAMYAGALAGGSMLAIAGRVPSGRPGRWVDAAALSAGVLLLSIGFVHLVADAPRGLADMAVLSAEGPHLDREPGILAVHLACAGVFAYAAVALARVAARLRNPLACCVALACMLEAVARLLLVAFPPVPNGWLHVADVCRLAFAVLLLVGAARAAREAAVGGERRRIAHGLHDGVAQELAFIRRHAQGPVLEAARRADEHTRRAIDVLSAPAGGLARGVERDASRAAEREGISLELVVEPGAYAPREVCEALASIAGEAVANAARHGRAETVRVELSARDRLRLRIADDGVGFDPGAASAQSGYGMVSMRERAEEIGARLAVASRPGEGTEVRVELR